MESQAFKIYQLGHPVLRKIADSVRVPIAPETRSLVNTMIDFVHRENGVGIAAPQVGRSQQIIIIASRPNLRYPRAPQMEPLPMINPVITFTSDASEPGWEGCLSIPGIRGQVERAQSVTVQYHDLDNRLQQQEFHGFVARIIQHECDHLQGIVFLDRVQSTHDLMTDAEFFRQEV
ncbi:MAG: peptide deformylase [Cyanobacteria bacterium P01_F01_bin.42]